MSIGTFCTADIIEQPTMKIMQPMAKESRRPNRSPVAMVAIEPSNEPPAMLAVIPPCRTEEGLSKYVLYFHTISYVCSDLEVPSSYPPVSSQ
jgi:hypothetical protein